MMVGGGERRGYLYLTLTDLRYLVCVSWYQNNQQSRRPCHARNKWQFARQGSHGKAKSQDKIRELANKLIANLGYNLTMTR